MYILFANISVQILTFVHEFNSILNECSNAPWSAIAFYSFLRPGADRFITGPHYRFFFDVNNQKASVL